MVLFGAKVKLLCLLTATKASSEAAEGILSSSVSKDCPEQLLRVDVAVEALATAHPTELEQEKF